MFTTPDQSLTSTCALRALGTYSPPPCLLPASTTRVATATVLMRAAPMRLSLLLRQSFLLNSRSVDSRHHETMRMRSLMTLMLNPHGWFGACTTGRRGAPRM